MILTNEEISILVANNEKDEKVQTAMFEIKLSFDENEKYKDNEVTEAIRKNLYEFGKEIKKTLKETENNKKE